MKFILRLFFVLALLASVAHAQTNTGNLSGTLLASASRTAATVTSADQTNNNWRGIHLITNVSAYVGGNYTPKIQGKDPVSGNYYDILVGPPISATGMTVMKIYPGIAAVTSAAAADFLPRVWRVSISGASTPSMTFSVGFFLEQ